MRTIRIDEISAADLLGAVSYYPPSGDLYFDIFTRLGEADSFETVDAETKNIEGTRVRVATPAALYGLKKDTVRAKDHQDAAALHERFNLNDAGFLRHCARYCKVAPRFYPRGVFKGRSIQEARHPNS